MKRIGYSIKLYCRYISINLRSMMQYKTSFFLSMTGQFLVSFNVFLGIFFMFQRFSQVEDFTYRQVLLCYSLVLMEFSLAEMFARGFDAFSGMVRRGEFDRILVRPQGEILQVLGYPCLPGLQPNDCAGGGCAANIRPKLQTEPNDLD